MLDGPNIPILMCFSNLAQLMHSHGCPEENVLLEAEPFPPVLWLRLSRAPIKTKNATDSKSTAPFAHKC